MTMTPDTGDHVEHLIDGSCCPNGGHWWVEDTELAAAKCREVIEEFGWTMTEATWEAPNWRIRATSKYGQIDSVSEHLGACFVHLAETLQKYGWFEEQYKVKK